MRHSENLFWKPKICAKYGSNSTQQYPADQLIKVVVKAGVNQRSIESIASQSSKTASADTTIRAIPKLSQQELEEFVNQRFAELLRRFLPQLRGKVWLAIDFHHEPRYGKKMIEDQQEVTYLSRINKQIQQVTSYATLAIVSLNGKYSVPFTVALSLNYKGRSRVVVIGDLLDTFFRQFEFDGEYLLLDGGLMSKEVISMLEVYSIHRPLVVFFKVKLPYYSFFLGFDAELLSLRLSSKFIDTTRWK